MLKTTKWNVFIDWKVQNSKDVKFPIPLKLLYKLKAIPIKIPERFFCRYRQGYLYGKAKELELLKTILKKN